jgi:hypothetical protein
MRLISDQMGWSAARHSPKRTEAIGLKYAAEGLARLLPPFRREVSQ